MCKVFNVGENIKIDVKCHGRYVVVGMDNASEKDDAELQTLFYMSIPTPVFIKFFTEAIEQAKYFQEVNKELEKALYEKDYSKLAEILKVPIETIDKIKSRSDFLNIINVSLKH